MFEAINGRLTKNAVKVSLGLFLLNLILKLLYISSRDIASDEPFTLYYAQTGLRNIFHMLYNENNPPFHFIFLHYWIKFLGLGAFAVRLPSTIFSAFTALFIYRTGSKFFSSLVGITASLTYTFSTMHIFFAHEARVYPLFCLLTGLSLLAFLNILTAPELKKNYILLFIANMLLIYSHYFGFLVLGMQLLSLILIKERKPLLKPLFFVMVLCGLSYLPMAATFYHRFGTSTANGTWVAPPRAGEIYGNLNRFLNTKYNTAILLILLLFPIIINLRNKTLKAKTYLLINDIYFRIVLLWFIVPYLFMFLISFKYPMFIDRYILFTSIPFYLIISIILIKLYEDVKYLILPIFLFIASLMITVKLDPDNNRRLQQVAQVVHELKKENTLVLIAPDHAFMGFTYYYNRNYFMKAPNTLSFLKKEKIYPISSDKAANSILQNEETDNILPDCIYVQAGSEFEDPDNLIFKALSKKYKKVKTEHIFEIYDIHYFSNK